ncbi:MAG: dockerin type I repeat-containing protein, partial [Prevotella sp.]|nr:dockerin type I repeat-containing protein [Prevotella sp.]
DYAILLKNVSLSNNLNESHSVEKLKSTLSVIDFIPGDVNGDLEVDVADFTLMANYLLGKTLTVFIMEAADVAGGIGGVPDGDIDVADLTGIANIILHQ